MWKNHFFQHVLVQHIGHQYQHLEAFINTSRLLTLYTHKMPAIARMFMYLFFKQNRTFLFSSCSSSQEKTLNENKLKKNVHAIKHTECMHTSFNFSFVVTFKEQTTRSQVCNFLKKKTSNFLVCFPPPTRTDLFYLEWRLAIADKTLIPTQKYSKFCYLSMTFRCISSGTTIFIIKVNFTFCMNP